MVNHVKPMLQERKVVSVPKPIFAKFKAVADKAWVVPKVGGVKSG